MTIHASGEFWEKAFKSLSAETADFTTSRPDENVVLFTEKYLTGGEQVLDLGCGGGRNSQYLAASDLKVCGMDISHSAVNFTRGRLERFGYNGTFETGDFREIPWEDSRFNAVFCIAALDHVTFNAAGRVLEEIRRVLKPGGRILLTFDPPDRDEELKGEAEMQEDGSLYFTRGEQKGMLFRRYTDQEIKTLIGDERIESFEHTDHGDRVVVCW